MGSPPGCAHFVSLLLPPTGGDTDGPAKPVPWCPWLAARIRALRVATPSPYPGATPTARRSRFRGVSGSPPRVRALRVASPSPYRGRHRRRGKAGSVGSLARPQASRTSCRFSFPLPGATPTARQSRFRGVSGSPPRIRALRVATPSPCRRRHRRPGKTGSVVSLALSRAVRTVVWDRSPSLTQRAQASRAAPSA